MCCQRESLLPKFQAESEVVGKWPVLEAASQPHGGAEQPTGTPLSSVLGFKDFFFASFLIGGEKRTETGFFFFLFSFLLSPFNESLILQRTSSDNRGEPLCTHCTMLTLPP